VRFGDGERRGDALTAAIETFPDDVAVLRTGATDTPTALGERR